MGHETHPVETPSRWRTAALKWVGGITAGVSLLLGVQQVASWASDTLQRRRQAATLVAMAREQSARNAYRDAWTSLDQASQLRPGADITDARIDVAFGWLQEARPGSGQPFRTITDIVTPALDRALVEAPGSRRADLLAHLGWATFLRTRDGEAGDPTERYTEALSLDPGNAYANAMLGHWLLWNKGDIAAARQRFEAALHGPAAMHPFVRRLQLAALMNRGAPADGELLRVATDVRQSGGAVPPAVANHIYWIYTMRYGRGGARSAGADEGLSPADLLATFEWIVPMAESARGSAMIESVRAGLGATVPR